MAALLRRCPVCGTTSEARTCTRNRIATFLVDPPSLDARGLERGRVVGERYSILRPLGEGGFGAVFAAQHTGTGQEVALKVLAYSHGDAQDALSRFLREAQMTAGLRHPNTVRVFDFGQDDSGVVYLAMELLEGRSLRAALDEKVRREDAFTESEAVAIMRQVIGSLEEAHTAGLVHRDLKPDNIFLHAPGGAAPVVKVVDFGVAKFVGSRTAQKQSSTVIGTPTYMSPEQCEAGQIDARSDIYALGVILYELVTGAAPFSGEGALQVILQHIRDRPPPLAARAQWPVSPAFVAAVERSLEKSPAHRPQTVRALETMLVARDPRAPQAEPPPLRPAPARPPPRSAWRTTGPVALFLLALIGAAAGWHLHRRGRGAAPVLVAAVVPPPPPASPPAEPAPPAAVTERVPPAEPTLPAAEASAPDASVAAREEASVAPEPARAVPPRHDPNVEVRCAGEEACIVEVLIGTTRARLAVDPRQDVTLLDAKVARRAGIPVWDSMTLSSSHVDFSGYFLREHAAVAGIWRERVTPTFTGSRVSRTFLAGEITEVDLTIGGLTEGALALIPVLQEAHTDCDGVLGRSHLELFFWELRDGTLRLRRIDGTEAERFGGRGRSWWTAKLWGTTRRLSDLHATLTTAAQEPNVSGAAETITGLDKLVAPLGAYSNRVRERMINEARRVGVPHEIWDL